MKYLQNEASRCLQCKNPKCQSHCPIDTPVPEIIRLFQEGDYDKASALLFENNPLSAVTAIVCPHEDQCLGNCIRGIKGEPVNFCKIERFLSENYLKKPMKVNVLKNHKKIAIIGSGPAGITAAMLLAEKGYDITIFELRDKIGGVLTYGIPEFRLPRNIVENLEDRLRELGVKIKPNTLVGPVITLDKLLFDGYSAIFIGTGVWNPKTLNIKGETLGHCLYAIDYLKNPKAYELGNHVVIIGAGNVAMDAARSARFYGSGQVEIYYRRGLEDMTATKAEIKEAKEEGVEFILYKSPVCIEDSGITFVSTRKSKREDGTVILENVPESEEFISCDNVIIAVSQSPQSNIVATSPELKTRYGLVVTDSLGYTTKEGVFACGDVVSGAKTVIDAVVAAKIVAGSIDEYCKGKN